MGVFKHGNLWWVRYTHEGIKVRYGVGTKKEAEAEFFEVKSRINNHTFKPPRQDKFEDLLNDYEAKQSQKAGYTSEKFYIRRIREYFKDAIVQDITVTMVKNFRDDLVALPTKYGKRRGNTDVNHHMVCLGSILNEAYKQEWISRNPAAPGSVTRPPIDPPRDKFLLEDEVGRLLDVCAPHLYPVVLCMVETGMRSGEVLGLRRKEVGETRLKDGSKAPMIYLPAERTKTRKARKVPVSDALHAVLAQIERELAASKVVAADPLMFQIARPRKSRRKGQDNLRLVDKPMSDVRCSWATALKKAELDPGLHLHDLRHTFISHMEMAEVGAFTLNQIVGHSSGRIQDTYRHLTDDYLVQAIRKLPKWPRTQHVVSAGAQMGTKRGVSERDVSDNIKCFGDSAIV